MHAIYIYYYAFFLLCLREDRALFSDAKLLLSLVMGVVTWYYPQDPGEGEYALEEGIS